MRNSCRYMTHMQQRKKCSGLRADRLLIAMEALHDEKWGDGTQQDAQEFLHALLDQLQVGEHTHAFLLSMLHSCRTSLGAESTLLFENLR